MIHRTASSRRRRASRSTATSPQPQRPGGRRPSVVPTGGATYDDAPPQTIPGGRQRRASIAVPESCSPNTTGFVTVTVADDDDDDPESEPEIEQYNKSPRGSLVPDHNRSPRGSIAVDTFNRRPSNCLLPEGFNRSPRNSIIPDTRGSRNNLLPEPNSYARGSTSPDSVQFTRSRSSLNPEDFNRSPRNSLVPGDCSRSARNSLITDTSPNSRTSRTSLLPEISPSRSSRSNSICPDPNRSPRGSICPEPNRTPRGSLVPDVNRSPRGSLVPDGVSRSPRGSIASEISFNRSPRNSLPQQESPARSPRGSIGSTSLNLNEASRSPRGSIDISMTGRPCLANRCPSPCKNQRNAHSTQECAGSRRASSSVSLCPTEGVKAIFIGPALLSSQVALSRKDSFAQVVSGDERRYLCEHSKLNSEGAGVAAYGSVVYQLNHANMEASGTCDFVLRGYGILYRTVIVTIALICLSALPLIMFIMGLQFVRDCPKESNIPVYMIVGGVFGSIKMFWLIWRQIRSRRFERRRERNGPDQDPLSTPSRVADVLLTLFLITWFILGNFWIMSIYWPDFAPTLYEPNNWCHKTLYVFSLIHLIIMYTIIGIIILVLIVLLACQICLCNLTDFCK
ncbi:Hypothetical protein NTJ_06262 [Nesidiocoris tenuis]|uniref:G-protein coupled receptors family 2 profile 2 domain-containing protein n=2 Tax=Nesidiocoris tenuis TaxID=355587 RepID=A0ABN7AN09_9HEMI|nr:Hypothetical protein NTJ_06262 [Nesidiocoris tenuis]